MQAPKIEEEVFLLMTFTTGWMRAKAVCSVKELTDIMALFTKQMTDGVPKKREGGEVYTAEEIDDPQGCFNRNHLSFALGELGLRLEEFYDMPWCEYLKCFAWARMEKEKWRHTRLIAFESRIGSHLDPKGLPSRLMLICRWMLRRKNPIFEQGKSGITKRA